MYKYITSDNEQIEVSRKLSDEEMSNRGIVEGPYEVIYGSKTMVETVLEEVLTQNLYLKIQIQALSDRNEFLEDCIAEMAMEVYSDPEEETV